MLSVIVAHTKNHVIGKEGQMPWHLPADLKHFKECTSNHTVIMGRKTFESIGRPLPNRTNVVISRNTLYKVPDGVVLEHSLEDAIAKYSSEHEECFVIGGGQLYQHAVELADRLYITLIDAEVVGDTTFPQYDVKKYKVIYDKEYLADEKNQYNLHFITYEKI